MTGQDYIKNRHLHPFWDESRDPNREDVVDAFEQGKAEGAREMKEQMMKGAVDGKIFMSFAPGHNQMVMADVDLPTNTKVKVIVIKEEKK